MRRIHLSRKALLGLVLTVGVALGFLARSAFAADVRYDEANALLIKAAAVLNAAAVPAGDKKCEKERQKAIKLVTQAEDEIAKIKTCIGS